MQLNSRYTMHSALLMLPSHIPRDLTATWKLVKYHFSFENRLVFFQISKFLSQTVRGSTVLCSVRFLYVLNTTLLRPWRFHCDYIASPRRPHGDHRRLRCDCATFSASLRRLYGDYCVCPATVLRVFDDPRTW